MNDKAKVKELIKCKINPEYFLKTYVYIEQPGGITRLQPYDAQLQLVRDILNYHYLCILKSRQIGISAIVQALCIYLVVFFPNITIGIISRDGPEATDFVRKCRIMLENLPKWMRPSFIKRTEQTFELSNNSRIIASTVNQSNPQGVFRGKTITFLIIDEAAFIRKIEDAFVGLSPSVTTAHRVAEKNNIPYGTVILSTPNGTTGVGEWFYKMYIEARTGNSIFKAVTIHYSQAPFADEKWLETQKRILLASKGPDAVEQELELKFIPSSTAFFNKQTFNAIQAIMESGTSPIETKEKVYFNKQGRKIGTGQWEIYHQLDPSLFYLIGVDVAPSYGKCNSAIEVCRYNGSKDLKQYAEFTGKLRVMDLEEEIKFIMEKLPNAYLIVEANTYATELVERLDEDDNIRPRLYYRRKLDSKGKIVDIQPGLLTDNKTRPKMMEALYWALTDNPNIISGQHLAAECLTLDKTTRSSRLTDRVMALCLILYVIEYDLESIPFDRTVNFKQLEGDLEFTLKDINPDKRLYSNYIKKTAKIDFSDEEFSRLMLSTDMDNEIWDPSELIESTPINLGS